VLVTSYESPLSDEEVRFFRAAASSARRISMIVNKQDTVRGQARTDALDYVQQKLDALDDPAADIDKNRLITPSGLEHYVENRVPMLTGDKQHPGMEMRYDTTLFARSR
jgi:hypothetical protein